MGGVHTALGRRNVFAQSSFSLGPEIARTLCPQPRVFARRNLLMSLGLILIVLLVVFLAGGFSGRFGGYGYGYGHHGMGCLGTILIVVLILFLLHRI